jgi:GntR family transcriptional repressor for pyruvate dehydrogenase complex
LQQGATARLKREALKDSQDENTSHSQLTMQVVEHVRALISSGEVRPGDRLPPERELARKLKISRSSLRAGIGFLSAMGVLKSRHGAGTFVSSGPPALDSSSLTVLGALHGFLPWQMFEARLVLESNVAALAAERATDEHIAELAEEVAEMYAALDDPQEYLIHDVRFHRTIARASGNPILGALMETITANLYDARLTTVQHTRNLKESAEQHREIFRAIRSRNPIQARRTMQEHLNEARRAEDAESDLPAKPAKPGPPASSEDSPTEAIT